MGWRGKLLDLNFLLTLLQQHLEVGVLPDSSGSLWLHPCPTPRLLSFCPDHCTVPDALTFHPPTHSFWGLISFCLVQVDLIKAPFGRLSSKVFRIALSQYLYSLASPACTRNSHYTYESVPMFGILLGLWLGGGTSQFFFPSGFAGSCSTSLTVGSTERVLSVRCFLMLSSPLSWAGHYIFCFTFSILWHFF